MQQHQHAESATDKIFCLQYVHEAFSCMWTALVWDFFSTILCYRDKCYGKKWFSNSMEKVNDICNHIL